jgi:type III pantothenate kinase
MPAPHSQTLIAVDIGNSRIKLGRFEAAAIAATHELPQPSSTCELPITNRKGEFDTVRLAAWSSDHARNDVVCCVASVHRGAADLFIAELANLSRKWDIRRITFREFPMPILLDEPARVGIDRLLASFAANKLRQRDRSAIVVDLGTAMTIDLVTSNGEFSGGAILPGIAMSARALAEQTDALPYVDFASLDREPKPIGKSTVGAIESGVFWGTVGAIRELIRQYSLGAELSPNVFLTGGASALIAELLAKESGRDNLQGSVGIQHVESLVLSGIALVHQSMPQS